MIKGGGLHLAKNKKDVIQLLEHIAINLEQKRENQFKISAYRKAALAMESDERALSDIDDFTKIKGIGKGTGAVIQDYLENETSETLDQLQMEIPKGLIPLLRLPGLGGKKVSKLYQELGITDDVSLKEAIESKQVESLAGSVKNLQKKF